MAKKIGIGVIGCGGISRLAHLPGIVENPDAELVALADTMPANLKAAAGQFSISETYANYQDLLASPRVDAVDICTPVFLHKQMVLAAAAAGKHVLCEKPLAKDAGEAQEMVEACGQAGVTLTIMHQQRFIDGFQHIKELIDGGTIGRIVSFRARSGHSGPDKRMAVPGSGMGTWVFDRDKSGGGVLLDTGVHLIDVLTWLVGGFDTVAAEMGTLTRTAAVEDHVSMLVRLANGAVGELELSWSQVAGRNLLEIFGTTGSIVFDRGQNTVSVFREAEEATGWQTEKFAAQDWFYWHRFVIADFVATIKGATPIATTGKESLRTMQIIDAAYQSNESGQRIVLVSNC
jgi:predicted dehydrogenase